MPGGEETGGGEGQGSRRGNGGGGSGGGTRDIRGGEVQGETAGEGPRTKRRIEEVEGAVAGRLELPAGPADHDDIQVEEVEADVSETARAATAREGQGRAAWGLGEALTGVMRRRLAFVRSSRSCACQSCTSVLGKPALRQLSKRAWRVPCTMRIQRHR